MAYCASAIIFIFINLCGLVGNLLFLEGKIIGMHEKCNRTTKAISEITGMDYLHSNFLVLLIAAQITVFNTTTFYF